jgi:hypothetical protein
LALEQLEEGRHINLLAQQHHETAAAKQVRAKYQGLSLATHRDDCNNNNKALAKAVKVAKPTP